MAKDSNWYIEMKSDKGKAPYRRSPDDGGFSITIKQRKEGGSIQAAHIEGVQHEDGTLGLYLITPEMPEEQKLLLALTDR